MKKLAILFAALSLLAAPSAALAQDDDGGDSGNRCIYISHTLYPYWICG